MRITFNRILWGIPATAVVGLCILLVALAIDVWSSINVLVVDVLALIGMTMVVVSGIVWIFLALLCIAAILLRPWLQKRLHNRN